MFGITVSEIISFRDNSPLHSFPFSYFLTSGAKLDPKGITAIACVNLNVVFILVQTPAPVRDIKVIPSATSALVTWSIVTTKENSSYITDYDIYLYPENLNKTIARKDHGTQFNITGLKPCSDYIVGIVALDGFSQRSTMRNISFITIEAGTNHVCYNICFMLPVVN